MQEKRINKAFLISLLGLLTALGPFAIVMYLPAFGQIAGDLYTDESRMALTLAAYFMGLSAGQLFYGPVVEKYGGKRPLLFGLTLYAAASLGCAWSDSVKVMAEMRFLQALGICGGVVAFQAIIRDSFEKSVLARAVSLMELVTGVAAVIAPGIGGFLVVHYHWQYIFNLLAVLSLLEAGLIFFWLPETKRQMHAEKLRFGSVVKSYLAILRNRKFLIHAMVAGVSMSVMFAYIPSAPLIFIGQYHLSPTAFTVIFAINASGYLCGGYLNRLLIRKVNYLWIGQEASWYLVFVAGVELAVVYYWSWIEYQWLVLSIVSMLLLVGVINANATAASLEPFERDPRAASALNGSMKMGMGALAMAMTGVFPGGPAIAMYAVTTGLSLIGALMAMWGD